MATFYANYPSIESAGSSGNPAAGPTGSPVPTDADFIGFSVGGTLTGVSAATPLPVTIESEVGTLNVNIAEYGGVATSLGQKTSVASEPVVIASDQSAVPISAASLPLPTGAATNAELITINTTLGSPFQAGGSIGNTSFIATQTTGSNLHVDVDNFPATQPVSGTVTADQGGTWTVGLSAGANNIGSITNVTGTVSLPTGASTSALQTTGNTSLASILANQTNGTQTVTGTGSAGTPATGVVTVQGISGGTGIPISNPLPSAPLTGQKTSTGTAVAISSTSQPLVNGVIVQALSTNVGLVYVGGSTVTTGTGFQLQAGQATSTAVNNLNEVYVISVSSGDGVCFIGS